MKTWAKALIGLGVVGGAVYFLTKRKTGAAAAEPRTVAPTKAGVRPTVIRPATTVRRVATVRGVEGIEGIDGLGQEMPSVDILPEQIDFDWNPMPDEVGNVVEPYLDPGANVDWYGTTTLQQPQYVAPQTVYPSTVRPTTVAPVYRPTGVPTQYPIGVQTGYPQQYYQPTYPQAAYQQQYYPTQQYQQQYYPTQYTQSPVTASYDNLITQGLQYGLISVAARQPARAKCVATNVLAASPYCAVVFVDRTGKKRMTYKQAAAYVQKNIGLVYQSGSTYY